MYSKRLSILLVALAASFIAGPVAVAAPIYTTVDQQLGTGFMAITAYGGTFSGGAWTINITAQDMSNTIAYNNVDLTIQFVYPGDANGDATGPGFTYLGGNIWNGGGPALQYTASSTGPLGSMLMSDSNAPQTWLSQPGNIWPAAVAPTDVVPLVTLGNFAPLQSESFTLTVVPNSQFLFQTVSFFVVPRARDGWDARLGRGAVGAGRLPPSEKSDLNRYS